MLIIIIPRTMELTVITNPGKLDFLEKRKEKDGEEEEMLVEGTMEMIMIIIMTEVQVALIVVQVVVGTVAVVAVVAVVEDVEEMVMVVIDLIDVKIMDL